MTPAGNGEECITTVLIHGNPETDAIWTDLVGELTDRSVTDLVLLSPPGFGAPIPDGCGATQVEYRDWLIALRTATRRVRRVTVILLLIHTWIAPVSFHVLSTRHGKNGDALTRPGRPIARNPCKHWGILVDEDDNYECADNPDGDYHRLDRRTKADS